MAVSSIHLMLSYVLNIFSLTKTLWEIFFPFVANFSCKGISKRSERTIISRNTIRSSIGWGMTLIISPKYITSRYIIKNVCVTKIKYIMYKVQDYSVLYTILVVDFGFFSTVCYFLCFSFYYIIAVSGVAACMQWKQLLPI